jgi:hypothetical protein
VLGGLLRLAAARGRRRRLRDTIFHITNKLARLPPRLVPAVLQTRRQRPDNARPANDIVLIRGRIHIGVDVRRHRHVVPDKPLKRVGVRRLRLGQHLGLLPLSRGRPLHVAQAVRHDLLGERLDEITRLLAGYLDIDRHQASRHPGSSQQRGKQRACLLLRLLRLGVRRQLDQLGVFQEADVREAGDLGEDLGQGDDLLRGHGTVRQVDAFEARHLGEVSATQVSSIPNRPD